MSCKCIQMIGPNRGNQCKYKAVKNGFCRAHKDCTNPIPEAAPAPVKCSSGDIKQYFVLGDQIGEGGSGTV